MRERQALFELIKLLELSEDINVLLERLIYHASELMNAQGGLIRLIKDGNLYITATYNIQTDKKVIPLDEGICGMVIKEGKVRVFNKQELEGIELDIPAYSAICIPLKIEEAGGEKVIGTILIYNKLDSEEGLGEFTEEDISLGQLFYKAIGVVWVDNLYTKKPITEQDINFLKGFADQVAAAIENAWIFEKVEKAEKELEMLFNSITDLLYYTDEYYTIKKVNKAFLDKTGKEEKDVINKKCFQILHKTEYPPKNCPHKKAIENKKPAIAEIEENFLEGVYLLSSSPIFDKNGNLIGTINLGRDITELRNLREKIASMEKMAALGELAAKVAHEIRNPLLAIGGFAKRLDKSLQDENLKEYVRVIVDETKRLERILNETLSFVKPYYMGKKPFIINELINDVVNFTDSVLKDKNNELIVEIQEDCPVQGNYDRLKEVLLNIITNANEATQNGKIYLRLKKIGRLPESENLNEEYFVIEIEDTGCGISEENMKKLFTPFFTTKTNGTGLGLAISKRIIEDHGGIISVESELNKGTIFKIYLPVYQKRRSE